MGFLTSNDVSQCFHLQDLLILNVFSLPLVFLLLFNHMTQFHSEGKFYVFDSIKFILSFKDKLTCAICSVIKYYNFGLKYLKPNYSFGRNCELKKIMAVVRPGNCVICVQRERITMG